jgi:hypothetical protein
MNVETIKSKIQILRNNEIYRVSDVLKFGNKHMVVKTIMDDAKYRDSILYKYLNIRKPDVPQIPILLDCIQKHVQDNKIAAIDDSSLVVHLRSGDAYKQFGLGNNIICLQLRKHITSKLLQCPWITNIIFVTAMHFGGNPDSSIYDFKDTKRFCFNSCIYEKNIMSLYQFLQTIPTSLPYDIISNKDIDYDLCILVTCKNFLPTLGGFSQLILKLRHLCHKKISRTTKTLPLFFRRFNKKIRCRRSCRLYL